MESTELDGLIGIGTTELLATVVAAVSVVAVEVFVQVLLVVQVVLGVEAVVDLLGGREGWSEEWMVTDEKRTSIRVSIVEKCSQGC